MAVYLDHAATSPLLPEVKRAYLENLDLIGNPSSVHSLGQSARRVVEEAREAIAAAVGAHRSEVIFTSGGTEADNLAVKGLFWHRSGQDAKRTVIISAATEHHAVIEPLEWLEKEQGAEVLWCPVNQRGELDLEWLRNVLAERSSEIAFISLMWANNEIGVLAPIAEITALAATHEIPVHSDAVAAFGHTPVNFGQSGLAAMSISGHKLGAPVGIGALIVSRKTNLTEVIHGGGQERGVRSGTLSAALAVALAEACRLAVTDLDAKLEQMSGLIVYLREQVGTLVPEAIFTRGDAPAISGNAHFMFPGCAGDSLLFLLDTSNIAVSTGSACRAGVADPSHVVIATGRSEVEARSCLRLSISPQTSRAEIDQFLAALPAAYASARKAGVSGR